MHKVRWALVFVIASTGWLFASGVVQTTPHAHIEDPLQQYYQPSQLKVVPPMSSSPITKVNVAQLEPLEEHSIEAPEKKEVIQSKTIHQAINLTPIPITSHTKEATVPNVVPTFSMQPPVLENSEPVMLELRHVNLEAPNLDQLNLSEFPIGHVSEDDKLQLLLLSNMVSWPTTIDHMAAEMLALSHRDILEKEPTVDPRQELEWLALSMMLNAEPVEKHERLDANELEMLALSDVLANESVYTPDEESGEMVLAQLRLADLQESAAAFNDFPAELALLAINDKHYKGRETRQYPEAYQADAVEPRRYARQSKHQASMKLNRDALQDYRSIDTWSASESHRTYTSKRHRSARHYAVPEKGQETPRYEVARAAMHSKQADTASNMQTAKAIALPTQTDAMREDDSGADLDLFAAPILTDDEPMLLAEAEMPRDPAGLFSDARLDKVDKEKNGKVSGNLFYSTRLKTGAPIIGSRLSFKPYDKWVVRLGAKTVLFGAKKDFNYSWGIGYEDWRPGQFSFALNNWGPIRLGQDPLAGAKFSIDYNVIKRPTLFGFPISFSPAIDFPLTGNAKLGPWAPTVGLGHTWKFADNWFAKIGVSRKLSAKAPWRWTYGFGRDSWRPFTFNVMYSNWGPNNDFRPNFRKNGRLSVEWKWLIEY